MKVALILFVTCFLTVSPFAAVMQSEVVSPEEVAELLGIRIFKKRIQTAPGSDLRVWIEREENGKKTVAWKLDEKGDAVLYNLKLVHQDKEGSNRRYTIHVTRIDPRGVQRGQGTAPYTYTVPPLAGGGASSDTMTPAPTQEVEIGKEYVVYMREENGLKHSVKIQLLKR